MEKTLKVSVGLLFVSALALGYFVYKRDNQSLLPKFSTEQNQRDTSMPEGRVYESPYSGGKDMTDAKALQSPKGGASAEEQQEFAALVKGFAKTTPSLELGEKCESKPIVFSLKEGTPLKIKNNSGTEQMLVFSDSNKFKIPKEGGEFRLDFARAGGIYAYGCASYGGIAGRIYITK